MEKEYKEGDTIYLLLNASRATALADEWLSCDYGCDLVMHRSKKNKGCVVVETKSILWANRIQRWFMPLKVTFKSK